MTPWSYLKSVASLIVITLNLSVWALPLVLIGVMKLIAPPFRGTADRLMDLIYRVAVSVDDAWLRGVIGIRWNRPVLDLDRNKTYVVVANHASWSDIFLLQSILVHDGPLLKFLVKRSLVWIPVLGVIFWAFDFPMLRRRSRTGADDAERRRGDLEALHAACRVLLERPAALMNFAEGTRFSPEKHAASESPYRHLLRPRAGGLTALLEALDGEVDSVFDVTIVYSRPVSFLDFLSGGVDEIGVDVERIPRAEIPDTREAQRQWLEDRWHRKDQRIDSARRAR